MKNEKIYGPIMLDCISVLIVGLILVDLLVNYKKLKSKPVFITESGE